MLVRDVTSLSVDYATLHVTLYMLKPHTAPTLSLLITVASV